MPFYDRARVRLSQLGFGAYRVTMGCVDPFREVGKLLVVLGVLLVIVGAWFAFGGRLPFRLGRLPGDVYHQGRHGTFYFPMVTCILVSVVLTLLFWIVNVFRR